MSAITDRIIRRYEYDQSHPTPALTPTDIPIGYDAFTPTWLTAVLCRLAPGAEVVAFQFDERDDGTTNRRRIFLEYNDVGAQANLPKTVFCKTTIDLSNRVTLGACGSAHAESTFYARVRPRLDIEAPTAYHAHYDPESYAYIVLLRDLTGKASFCTECTTLDRMQAQSQVLLLADLHGAFYGHADLHSSALPLTRWTDWWANLQTMDYGIYCRKGVEAAEAVFPARLFARKEEIWPATMESVRQHLKLPETVLHADVHLKNWYLTSDGRMGLSDWQNCCIGHWGRDLAYAITTALGTDQRRLWERDLIDLYLDRLESHGIAPVDREVAFRIYRQQILSALAYWTSTLCPPDGWADMQPSTTSIAFIRRMAAAIDDLDSLDGFRA